MTNFTFEDWLNVATRDLCADARERVCEEVSAHHTASYDVLIASGELPDMAAAGALASLGRAKKARRKYRRTYITKREQKYLDSLADTKTAWMAYVCAVPVGFSTLVQAFLSGSTAVIIHGMAVFVLFLGTITALAHVRTRFQHDLKHLLRLLSIGMTFQLLPIFMYGTFLLHLGQQPPMNGALLTETGLTIIGGTVALLCLMVVFFRGRLLRIHRKLAAYDDRESLGRRGEK